MNGCLANGGLYIKIGQGVSAINHILPPEYTNTLRQLEVHQQLLHFLLHLFNVRKCYLILNLIKIIFQNECLPRKPDEVKRLFVQEFGKEPDELFAEFDYEPIAAASLAQVFKAKCKDGRDVAVKVQYIDLIKRFSGDFATIQFLQGIIKIVHKNYNFSWILNDLRGNLEQVYNQNSYIIFRKFFKKKTIQIISYIQIGVGFHSRGKKC